VKDKFIDIALTYEMFLRIEEKRVLKETVQKDNLLIEHKDEDIKDNIALHIIKQAPSFKKTIKKIIGLMNEFNFKGTPSVDRAYDIQHKNRTNNYDLLFHNMDLYAHTLHVAYEILQFSRKGNTGGINILIALLHDFGKSHKVIEMYSDIASLSHEKISAKFAEDFLLDEMLQGDRELSAEVIEVIKNTIDVQHSEVKNKSLFLQDIISADSNARRNEITFIKKKIGVKNDS